MDSIFLLYCYHKIEIPVAKIVMRTLCSQESLKEDKEEETIIDLSLSAKYL